MRHHHYTLLIFFSSVLGYSLAAQPARITDINPGSAHSFPPGAPGDVISMVIMSDHLYFVVNDGIHGSELWVSDGTTTGTTLVKDIKPGSGSSNPFYLTVFNDKLYFSANDGTSGTELWVSDGTEAGTKMLTDLQPGSANSAPRFLTILGDHIYFAANKSSTSSTLWKINGSEMDAIEIKSDMISALNPRQLTALGNNLYFAGPGGELWTTDGTDSGTVLIKEIAPGYTDPFIDKMVAIGGKLYFEAQDESLNDEPWISDGTESGTMKLKEISLGIEGSSPKKYHYFKDHVYFSAVNKLWRTDGTPEGTALFKNIIVFPSSNDPAYFISDADYLYFPADDGINGVELWRSDGTPDGTILLKNIDDIFFSSDPEAFAWGSDGLLYFSASQSGYGEELWRTDGTPAGTLRVTDLNAGPGHADPQSLIVWNGTLYFVANDGIHGRELWKYDLTTAVDEQKWSNHMFEISPNPAKDNLYLTSLNQISGEEYSVCLFDLSGRQLLLEKFLDISSDKAHLTTSHLTDGLYLLQIVSEHGTQVEKVIIAH